MSYLKDITFGGVTNDIFFPYIEYSADNRSSGAVTSYTTPAQTVEKGTYIISGRAFYMAGSGTGSARLSVSVNVGESNWVRARFTTTPNNQQFDIPFTHSFEVEETTNISVTLSSTVARTIGANWQIVKITVGG